MAAKWTGGGGGGGGGADGGGGMNKPFVAWISFFKLHYGVDLL